jgi:UDP-N-acetylmuramoylalanine--D-glutamate ligase
MAGSSILLIAGGLAKGDDPKSVIPPLTGRVKKVYLIGRCAEVFFDAWSNAVNCEVCGEMERAVESAMRDAVSGDTVLLSPGTASFDQFQSFEQRGDVFAELVKKEGQKKK